MKKVNKIMSLLLALLMVISFTQPSTATIGGKINQENDAKVIRDNKKERVAVSVDLENKYISNFNKDSNSLTIQSYDKTTNKLVTTQTIDLSETILEENNSEQETNLPSTHAIGNSEYQKTLSNYEYSVKYGKPNKWNLRVPSERMSKSENSSNSANIKLFRKKVESINTQEKKIAGAIVGTGLLMVLTIIATATPGALPSALAAAGVFGTAVFLCFELKEMQNDSKDLFRRIKYN